MSWQLEVHPGERWADAVAAAFVERLTSRPRLRVVLPTGDTPTPLYEALSRTSADLWSESTVIVLDDYVGLGPDDPAAAGPRLRRELVDRVRPGRFVTIDADSDDPAAAAAAHDAVAAEGIDLAVVGLGLNGHVGFNEPGSGPDAATRVVELSDRSRQAAEGYGTGAEPRRGITLGIGRLLAAEELWLLVTGAHKADVLRAAMEGPETADVPASWLRRHPGCRVVADEAAAASLRR